MIAIVVFVIVIIGLTVSIYLYTTSKSQPFAPQEPSTQTQPSQPIPSGTTVPPSEPSPSSSSMTTSQQSTSGTQLPLPTTTQVQFSSIIKSTDENDDGGGNAVYLDRHFLNCGDKAVLNQFNLARTTNKYKYDYTCNSRSDIESSITKTTDFDEEGSGNMLYFDRHNINCDQSGINNLKLERDGKGKIRFSYACSKVPNITKCEKRTTAKNEDGGGNAFYLDRHNVKCNANEILTQLKLSRPDEKSIQYEYTCCS